MFHILCTARAKSIQEEIIIGSIFPEKLEFDEKTYQTAQMDAIVSHIFQINNRLPQNKNRKNDYNNHFSCLVARRGIEPLFLE